MSAANTSNLGQILKTIWTQDDINEVFYSDFPLLAMVKKDTSWSGEARVITVPWGQVAIGGSRFDVALANRRPSRVSKMTITTNDYFVIWSVDHKLITLSRNDTGAVMRALDRETKSAMKRMKRTLGWLMYGDGGGSVGSIASISTTTITLNRARDSRNFEPGMELEVYSNSGARYGSVGTNRPGTLTVADGGVNTRTGVITFTATVATAVPLAAANDYLFPTGDYQNVFCGIDSYVPNVADASVGTLWSMLRTDFRNRLAGVRVGGKGQLVEEAIKRSLMRLGDAGGECSHVFLNTEDYYDLEMANQSKKYGTLDTKVGTIGFRGMEFTGHNGKVVSVYPDPECPKNLIYGLDLSDCVFATAGEFPDFLTVNGNKYELEPAANAAQGRIGGYGQFYLETPGNHFVCDRTLAD